MAIDHSISFLGKCAVIGTSYFCDELSNQISHNLTSLQIVQVADIRGLCSTFHKHPPLGIVLEQCHPHFEEQINFIGRNASKDTIHIVIVSDSVHNFTSTSPGIHIHLVSKPIRIHKIVKLLQELQLHQNVKDDILELPLGVILHCGKRSLTRDGIVVRLTEKEVEFIQTLSEKRGETVEKPLLMEQVWKYRPDIDTHTIETHVYRLRKKLEALYEDVSKVLVTTANGYKLADLKEENPCQPRK